MPRPPRSNTPWRWWTIPQPFKVLICRDLPEPAEALVSAVAEVEVWREDRPIPRDFLLQKVPSLDGVITLLTDRVDEELLRRAPNLKVVSNYAVGFDNVDTKAAKAHGVVVTNTPEVLTDTTADLTWALLLAAARRIPESDRFTRNGRFVGWKPKLFLGVDVFGKTLGVVGLGRIGYAVARRAKGFNMRVLYYDALGRMPDKEKELGLEFRDLPALLKDSDFISLHAPLMPETRHLIGEQELRSMKSTAVLVNAARGPLVDEIALVKALKEHWIFAAGLDVYEEEPKLAPGLADLPNAILVAHIGSASIETRSKMAEVAAKNLIAVLEGKPAISRVA